MSEAQALKRHRRAVQAERPEAPYTQRAGHQGVSTSSILYTSIETVTGFSAYAPLI